MLLYPAAHRGHPSETGNTGKVLREKKLKRQKRRLRPEYKTSGLYIVYHSYSEENLKEVCREPRPARPDLWGLIADAKKFKSYFKQCKYPLYLNGKEKSRMPSEKAARPDFRKATPDTADTWLMSVVKMENVA